jgi:hypothetical protein
LPDAKSTKTAALPILNNIVMDIIFYKNININGTGQTFANTYK